MQMKHSGVRGVICAFALGLAMAGSPLMAQEKFPSRPLEMIVVYAPGGGTDIIMRLLAEIVEPILGQKVVVVNRAGGGGVLGAAAMTQAKPDGYTLGGVSNAPLTMVPHMQPAPYTPNDYEAISLADSAPTVLCVKADFPANSAKELIEHIRANANKYTYGTDGVGGTIQLSFERIFIRLGIKVRPVPFGGAGETLQSYLGGHINIFGGSIPPILPYIKDGSTKCLLLTGPDRVAALPQASSLTDLGMPDASTLVWHGVAVPKGVPADRVAILEKAFRQAANSDKFRQFVEARGFKVEASSAAEFRKLLDNEYKVMGEVMKTIGLIK